MKNTYVTFALSVSKYFLMMHGIYNIVMSPSILDHFFPIPVVIKHRLVTYNPKVISA